MGEDSTSSSAGLSRKEAARCAVLCACCGEGSSSSSASSVSSIRVKLKPLPLAMAPVGSCEGLRRSCSSSDGLPRPWMLRDPEGPVTCEGV
eukprot:scaffold13572_cov52-Phaeocystis_antarctica.AAC.4